MELLGVVTLILGVMGALAFIRVSKLESHLKGRGILEDGFDSLDNLGDWGSPKQSHER